VKNLKDLFLLDPEVAFLNHGSFGACPHPVMAAYQDWQRRLERQPVAFLGRELAGHLLSARQILGAYLGAAAEDLVFISNATYGVNAVARSLRLQPGDEILSTDHEYGACDKTWQHLCDRQGAVYRRQPIPLPASSNEEILEQIWAGANERTRLIFCSHITSPTALTLPAAELCRRARQAGILCMIDGAHAPGQIDLDLEGIGADFYTGNCHKWMLAPKGSAFLYARRERQDLLEPLVVSWGWQAAADFTTGSRFVDLHQWRGTDDPSACLTVPAAIQFMKQHNWAQVRLSCHTLLAQAVERLESITGMPALYPPGQPGFSQMAAVEIPWQPDLKAAKDRLYADFRVEVPLLDWNGRHFVRISVQGYNTSADLDRLAAGLAALLEQTE
jgi:isopenicillin-N epimerase